jgi:uncharacterized protein (DUF924 family)
LEHSENLKDQRLSVEKFSEFRELEQDKVNIIAGTFIYINWF